MQEVCRAAHLARQVEGAVVGEADGAGSGGAGLVPAPQPSSLHQGFNTAQLQGYWLENVP